MPNFDVWYPLGISATLYSLLTLWLAMKRFVRKVRKMLGIPVQEKESIISPTWQPMEVQIEYPFATIPMQTLQMSNSSQIPKNDL